ncbi:MAG: hypothetical protein BWY70_01970 [Bacteroidetes bacterium ADurb.Bin408]|nr:MAG: hypothetical protein BWY70_01970 [Bacteroidetes bacterium ADurb.Bin408]
MAQKTHDDTCMYAVHFFSVCYSFANSVEKHFEWNAVVQMCLRVEKYFGMYDVLSGSFFQVCHRHLVKVLFAAQYVSTGIINIKELLQVAELISVSELFNVVVFERDIITGGKLKHLFRFKSAFDVQMKFCLGDIANKFRDIVHRS